LDVVAENKAPQKKNSIDSSCQVPTPSWQDIAFTASLWQWGCNKLLHLVRNSASARSTISHYCLLFVVVLDPAPCAWVRARYVRPQVEELKRI
jgi:hypothetical protein